jgi:hypothetical protein
MSTAWRWFSRGLLVLFALLATAAALYAYGRLTTPTASQREALALMQARTPAPEGENGFTFLMAAPPPEGAWPAALSCRGDGVSCLDAVQSAPEAHEAALLANAAALEAAERALRTPVFRNPDPSPAPEDALPPFQMVTRLPARRAFDFLAGREAEALDAACRDAGDLARWSRTQDSLIHAMIAVAGFRQNAGLIAEMRARSPATPLPASCTALADPPDPAVEGIVCDSLRGELRWIENAGMRVIDDVPEEQRAMARWLHSPEQFTARTAERLAGFCGPVAEADAARDAIDVARLDVPPRAIDRLSFAVSSILSEIAGPTMYVDYWERQLDHVARRRLLSAVLQMDAMDPQRSPRERFLALPEALREGPRPLRFDVEANTLGVALRGRHHDGTQGGNVVLPLPDRAPPHTVTADTVVNMR